MSCAILHLTHICNWDSVQRTQNRSDFFELNGGLHFIFDYGSMPLTTFWSLYNSGNLEKNQIYLFFTCFHLYIKGFLIKFKMLDFDDELLQKASTFWAFSKLTWTLNYCFQNIEVQALFFKINVDLIFFYKSSKSKYK